MVGPYFNTIVISYGTGSNRSSMSNRRPRTRSLIKYRSRHTHLRFLAGSDWKNYRRHFMEFCLHVVSFGILTVSGTAHNSESINVVAWK